MSRIVCGTNAGEDSRMVHIAAFERAAALDHDLTFLHVIGGSGYLEQGERMRDAIRDEMRWLLHALVWMARDRAGTAGVDADLVLREGDPQEQIVGHLQEVRPALLLLGVPREDDASIFRKGSFNEFVARVDQLGVRVELVSTARPEESS